MTQAADIINLEEFRKRRESKSPSPRTHLPMHRWTPVWVWVMVWPA